MLSCLAILPYYRRIVIYEKAREKADEPFELVYEKAVSLAKILVLRRNNYEDSK